MPAAAPAPVPLAYDDVGTGSDVLLLIHGHPFNRSMWRPQMAALGGSSWRLLAPDLRGYGQSPVQPGKVPLHAFATDLASLLDALGIPSVVVAGLSMGGQIAMELCRQLPHRVRGLLLAATFPEAETPEGKVARNAMADRLLREGMDGYAHEVLPKMLAPRSIETWPEVAERVLSMMKETNPVGAAAALRGRAERPSYEGTLAGLTVPALVVVGSADAYTTRRQADGMHSLLRSSELLWLPDIGHMPNLEAPDRFNQGLARLLDRVNPSGTVAPFLAGLPDPRST